jgi:5-hydroxyisourate hydrolase
MITTQVIDTALGRPAKHLPVVLDIFVSGQGWGQVGQALTDDNGEITGFGELPTPGIYRLTYDVEAYHPEAFYPTISITFQVHDTAANHHMPLLMSRYGYSTYRAV